MHLGRALEIGTEKSTHSRITHTRIFFNFIEFATIHTLAVPHTAFLVLPRANGGAITLAARGLEEPCLSFPDFCDNCQFHVIYCVSSHLCTSLFRRFSDSRFKWIHDFEENLTESFGPVPFSAQYRICRPVRTDGQTDRRIDGWTDGQTDKLLRDGPAGYEFTRSFGSCELSPS